MPDRLLFREILARYEATRREVDGRWEYDPTLGAALAIIAEFHEAGLKVGDALEYALREDEARMPWCKSLPEPIRDRSKAELLALRRLLAETKSEAR